MRPPSLPLLGLGVPLLMAACGPASPPPVQVAAGPAEAAPDEAAVARAARIAATDRLLAVRVEGLTRFDRVSMLEAGLLCGTRKGMRPVCATRPEWQSYAEPYEALEDVVAIEALDGCRCVLSGDGSLRCLPGAAGAGPPPSPRSWPVIAQDVEDFVISPSEARGPTLVHALDRRGNVLALPVPDGGGGAKPGLGVVARGARAIASVGSLAACALLRTGDVVCGDSGAPGAPMVPVPGPEGIVSIFYGGVAIAANGAAWTGLPREPRRLSEVPGQVRDYAPQASCALTADGAVACGGLARGWVDVKLPERARRIAARGMTLCAELADGTTACWGPFLADVVRLGARRPSLAP